MKLFLAGLIIFFAANMMAAERFICLPSMRQTNIYVEQTATAVSFDVRNPMGYDFMPQFDGPVSVSTIPFQKMQFQDLTDLGDFFTLSWSKDSCEFDKIKQSVHCEGPVATGIKDLKAHSISTIEITEKIKDVVHKKNRYRISFEKAGNFYFVSLDFMAASCQAL